MYLIKLNSSNNTFRLTHVKTTFRLNQVGRRGLQGEPGEGVLAGGTTGQALVKASNTDFDTEWSNAGSGDMAAAVYDPQAIADDAFDVDNHTNGTTNKVFTAVEKTKLAAIEAGAEVNNISDANATDLTDAGDSTLHFHVSDRARANHTGSQAISTVSGLQTAIDDKVNRSGDTLTGTLSARQINPSASATYDLGTSALRWAALYLGSLVLYNASGITFAEGSNILTGTTTGTKFGATTNQKIAFFGSTPIIQPSGNLITALSNLGLVGSGSLTKSDVGLGNVDNTSDASKPVSTAQQTALDLKANDADVVHDTGNETIAGVKTFSSDPLIPDEAYGVGWNGSLEPPTKNAVYDKIETIGGGGSGTVDSVVAGNNIDVDATDPANPIVSVETLTPADIGLAASVTELDYVDGVTSAIQTQLDGKEPLKGADDNYVTDAEKVVIGNTSGTNTGDQILPVKATGAEVDTGTDDTKFLTPKAIEDSSYAKEAYADAKVADAINDGTTTIAPSQNAVFDQLALKQPLDSDLTTIAGLTATTDNFMVATASAWASRTPTQARSQMGLGTIATQAANNVTITGGSITGITDLAIADGGTAASTAAAAFDNLKQAATDSATGVVELTTAAEVTTGDDDTRAISPKALADSTIFGRKAVSVQVFDGTTDVTTGDGKAYLTIPEALNGMNLVRAQATVVTAGTTNATTVMIHNKTDAVDMLSGAISIASAGTVGTVGTINASNDDVATNDVLRIDVDSVSTTAPRGLMVVLEWQLP